MKYLVFFLILSILNLFSSNGYSTVVYLQSSKTKDQKFSKVKDARSSSVKITRNCPSGIKRIKTVAVPRHN